MISFKKMNNKSRKLGINHNLTQLLQNRERKGDTFRFVPRHFQFTNSLIKRLGLEFELEGHQGCVNCLEWSADGRRLASGSDDTNIMIWDPFRHRHLRTLPTPHIGNIFSVKFLGNDESFIATAAGDCRVIVQSLEHAAMRQTPHLDCGCHVGRVKRLVKAPEQPLLFWSAGEDGLVIQYDMRESHECLVKSKVFIDISYTSAVKCLAVNPTRPHLLAVGANDCFIRLYDRRMVKTSAYRQNHTFDPRKRTPPEKQQDPNCVQYYAPGHLAKDSNPDLNEKIAATYIVFDATGSEMLVNMGGEHIYLYDINKPRHVNELRVPECLSKKKRVVEENPCLCAETNGRKPCKSLSTYNKRIAFRPCACDCIGRANMLLKRKWTGDIYSAARDFLYVIENWAENKSAYVGLIKCLIALKWSEEAYSWLEYIRQHHPHFAENDGLKSLQADLAILKNNNKRDDSEEHMQEKSLNDDEKHLREDSRDYEFRYLGHCNTTTDIKEVNFLGEDGKFICAGSDDGIIFIWDRKTTSVVRALWADVSIVNCVQPHPSACFIASSGIDPVVKLWSPASEDGAENSRVVADPSAAVEANQQRMSMDPFETMLANMGYRISPLETQEMPSCRTS